VQIIATNNLRDAPGFLPVGHH